MSAEVAPDPLSSAGIALRTRLGECEAIIQRGLAGLLAALALAGCHRTPANFGPLPVVDVASGANGAAVPELESGVWAAQGWTPACRWSTTNPASNGTSRAVTLTAGQTFASHDCGSWQFVNPGQGRP